LPVFAVFIWDIFFSPLSTQSRLFSALYVAMAAVLLERHRLRLAVTARPEAASVGPREVMAREPSVNRGPLGS
jgi:hypothetical protein